MEKLHLLLCYILFQIRASADVCTGVSAEVPIVVGTVPLREDTPALVKPNIFLLPRDPSNPSKLSKNVVSYYNVAAFNPADNPNFNTQWGVPTITNQQPAENPAFSIPGAQWENPVITTQPPDYRMTEDLDPPPPYPGIAVNIT